MNQVTPASLRYPLSVFNKNSTLERTQERGKKRNPRLCLFRSLCMHLFSATVSRRAFMCDIRCTAQICYSWDSLGIETTGMRKSLSLSERGVQHLNVGRLVSTIFLSEQRAGYSTHRRAVNPRPSGANAESARASPERGLGDCACAKDVVLARASMLYVMRALFV